MNWERLPIPKFEGKKVRLNAICPFCDSGKKFKKCCKDGLRKRQWVERIKAAKRHRVLVDAVNWNLRPEGMTKKEQQAKIEHARKMNVSTVYALGHYLGHSSGHGGFGGMW